MERVDFISFLIIAGGCTLSGFYLHHRDTHPKLIRVTWSILSFLFLFITLRFMDDLKNFDKVR